MKLHIGNLPKDLSDADLKSLVVKYAEPSSLEIVRDQAGVSKGYGFAEFASDDSAKAVIAGLDGSQLSGQTLKLGEARPRKTAAPRV